MNERLEKIFEKTDAIRLYKSNDGEYFIEIEIFAKDKYFYVSEDSLEKALDMVIKKLK